MAKLEPKRKMAETSEDPCFVYFRETQSSGVTAVPAITHTPSWTGLRGFRRSVRNMISLERQRKKQNKRSM